MSEERIVADRYEYTVYVKHGVTYVPHYRNSAAYVGPGYPEQAPKLWTEQELVSHGASPKQMMLWSRPRFGTHATEI